MCHNTSAASADATGSLAMTTSLDSYLRLMDVRNPNNVQPVSQMPCKSMHLWQGAFSPSGDLLQCQPLLPPLHPLPRSLLHPPFHPLLHPLLHPFLCGPFCSSALPSPM